MSDSDSPRTLWPQVISLGLLNAAMALAWLAYQLYLPSLLTSLGVAASFAATLLLVESILMVVLEPVFGFGSDVTFRRMGTRWPLILLGCLLSAVLLVGIPAFLLGPAARDPLFRTIAIGMLVAWAMAMTVCRTPVLALLGRYTTPSALPQAAAIMTVLTAGVAALRPGAKDFILGLGPLLCFGIASGVMLACMALLQLVDSGANPVEPEPSDPLPSNPVLVGLVALGGAAFGIANKMAFGEVLPRALGTVFPPAQRDQWMVGAFVALALSALLVGTIAKKLGNNRTMLFGALFAGVELLVLSKLQSAPVILTAIGIFILLFATVANGVFPFVFARVPHGRGGLGLGFWFGGLAAGGAAFSWLVPKTDVLSPLAVAQIGLGALVVLAVIVLQTSRAPRAAGGVGGDGVTW